MVPDTDLHCGDWQRRLSLRSFCKKFAYNEDYVQLRWWRRGLQPHPSTASQVTLKFLLHLQWLRFNPPCTAYLYTACVADMQDASRQSADTPAKKAMPFTRKCMCSAIGSELLRLESLMKRLSAAFANAGGCSSPGRKEG
eukprot:5167426-Amphidinium_carterae.1